MALNERETVLFPSERGSWLSGPNRSDSGCLGLYRPEHWGEKRRFFVLFSERWNRQGSKHLGRLLRDWLAQRALPGDFEEFQDSHEVLPHTLLLLLLPLSSPTSSSSLPPHFAFFKNLKLCLTFFLTFPIFSGTVFRASNSDKTQSA